jgi:2-polyprenyl-3-methyl-5-hydroxy-6-metoxy-1,4-benzoquinol methylase
VEGRFTVQRADDAAGAEPVTGGVIGLTEDRLRRIAQLEEWHFWFVARTHLVSRLLERWLADSPATILDVGCATGMVAENLARSGHRVVGIDARVEAIPRESGTPRAATFLRGDATTLPFSEHRFDAVLLLDVMEHTDDAVLLSEVCRVLRPGGVLLLTVPAIEWLWSYRDEAAGHLRRYCRSRLQNLLVRSGLNVCRIRYFNSLMTPIAVVTRLLGRRTPRLRDAEERPGRFVNRILTLLLRTEVRASNWLALPWGTSLVAVCFRR